MADVSNNCKSLVTPIKALQKINSDIFGDLDAYELKGQMEKSVVVVSSNNTYLFSIATTYTNI